MATPERLEELGVTDLRRVEPYLNGLGVAGAVAADLTVGRTGDVAAGVADGGLQHSGDRAEGCLHTPETSGRERRALGSFRAVALERRQRLAGGCVPVAGLEHVRCLRALASTVSRRRLPFVPHRGPITGTGRLIRESDGP